MKVTIISPIGEENVRGGSKNSAPTRMVHIAAVTNDWKLAILQLCGEGSSYFVEHLPMAATERIKLFTKSIWGKSKVVISEVFIRSCSHFVKCEMWSKFKQTILIIIC